MKKRSLWLLPLAGALALTGCADSGNEAPAASDEAQASEQAPAAEPLSSAKVKEVVEKLVADESGAQIIDGAAIAESLPQAKELVKGMNIEPAKCAELVAQQSSWDIEGINMAVATVAGAEAGESTSYSVASYEDDAKLSEIKKTVEAKDLQGCDSFSMEMQGMKLNASAEMLDATSDAEVTTATKTSISMEGTEVPMGSYTVQGLVGPNAVSISYSGAVEDEQAKIDELVKELNVAVAELEKAQ
ncbi:hypothetical protein CQ010_00750 [Arthrobacter sp. MYb211]|uniref:hypothetical protein n=1 Tax=unclassified Arthrobacter TaxID=235627 RepID=UPI000CFAF6DD|nr:MULTISPECIES: hypothetical protein [unclassified Arthrobacter]PRA13209.1 hypothetical protein CQ015_03005 [Arthrobacter sp. MYb221]PRC10403.1 hypothetical protein CQ010_00750 [Arthrobacter sp. MYb211]